MKKILIVEDEIIIVMDLTMRLTSMGFEVIGHAADSEKAVELALAEEPDLVIMDIFLEGQHDGIFAAEIISTEMDIPIVFLTSHSDSNTVKRAKKVLSYGYIVKPYSDRELNEKILLALDCHKFEHNINKLDQEKSGEKAMNPHARAKELLKDLFNQSHETVQHSFRLKIWGQKLGRAIGLSEESVEQIGLSCLLHDIGKTTISQDILNKEEKLSNEEWEKVKKHCEEGANILRKYKEFENIADYILYHHEHWDGSGYPEGLNGYDIPLIARIIAIADAYDVMTHERGYSKVISKSEALLELERKKDKQFDPDLVDIFIESMINIEEIKSANQA